MIHIQGKLPRKLYIAVSGGVDSMAILNFLGKSHDIEVLFFDHGTQTSQEASWVVKNICSRNDHKLHYGSISRDKLPTESLEEYWRNERYKFLTKFSCSDRPVITCHHLDDCVEQWIFSSLHGNPNIIPYRRDDNIIRPFRLTTKIELLNWAKRHNVEWHEDYSNEDIKYMRNYIRHELLPKLLVVNPGLAKVIRKKVEADYVENC